MLKQPYLRFVWNWSRPQFKQIITILSVKKKMFVGHIHGQTTANPIFLEDLGGIEYNI